MTYAQRKEDNAKALLDPRVKAVRDNDRVGLGSCSTIDECYEHTELLASLEEDGVKTADAAVKWALESEGLHIEQGLNASSGEPDCRLRKQWEEWENFPTCIVFEEE
jgi:hypothetical protein